MIVCSQCGSPLEDGLLCCTECGVDNPCVSHAQTLKTSSSNVSQLVAPRHTQVNLATADPNRTAEESNFVSLQVKEQRASTVESNPAGRFPRPVLFLAGGIVGAVFLLFLVAVGSGWLSHDSGDSSISQTNVNQEGVNASVRPESVVVTPTPAIQPSTIVPVASPSPTQSATSGDAERNSTREIEAALQGWVGASNAHDLDTHMSYYADTLDIYFSRTHVSSAYVRADRSRAYTRYNNLDVRLSNLSIRTEDTPATHATAVFDKSFRFEGDKVLSGSVQQTVWLTKIGGRWLITGEKDSKVYYLYK